ncbi:MAG: nucleotidyl transferase AbiEii/AbiGii toxin family protein [Pseudonocardiales bacterium]|nr:nucleotidyl transferase AbiEii/AbiGii toxin family protein [Actinomycetota bacterium]PZS21253.1 MAG: nucleotidyl transferase AbiEii/AbiGii toxin family protein [Pseudonocardiales bacterium]
MSPNPSRATTAGRVFNDLRSMARREGRSTDELLVFYVLERFLHRVSRSPFADQLVLKGGMLLAVLDARRSTRDADLLALELDRDEQRVAAWVREIASADIDDGVVFAVDRLRSQQIREGDLYPGVRITVPAAIGKARLNLVLDVNFGDPVTPCAIRADFPQLLDESTFPMWTYPVETVVAEKVSTMIALGDLNTRDRDWADLWRLTCTHNMSGRVLRSALERTSTYRGIALRPLSRIVVRLPQLRQSSYTAWRRRQMAEALAYPGDFAEVVRHVIGFADPLISDQVGDQHWRAVDRVWSAADPAK